MSLQPARVRHHLADVVAFAEVAAAWLVKAPAVLAERLVAAGPSRMRNDYLRCLVGEYAPASGHAAVRTMSEVASMYLLVGEAERRAVAERAVVDNMKEAYVSLGPRAVIVHTDLRNAYNEAWRRTIIQRHIDCSPLHPAIPVLLASLSTDSFLLVDDRSAPMRSEDGVQQGRPLATTSFFVAIHPEVHECDSTLVTYGAARFNADDGYFVGLPAHVRAALHAFRTSITASVGLEVRFNKMHAYMADMEAARREAPVDIHRVSRALDGHHGIPVLNVPLGSAGYVHAYMGGKAEELQEEVDDSLSKLMYAKPRRRYTFAFHHHA
eukprot:jgi/Tetstr1/446458/TSEL_033999.t1